MYTYPVPAWYRNDWASNDSYLKLSKGKVVQSIEIAQGVVIDIRRDWARGGNRIAG